MTPKSSIFERWECGHAAGDPNHVTEGKKKCASSWWARVRYVDAESGKPKDLQRRADSRADAIDKRDKLSNEIKDSNGRSVGSERKTFADLCDYYETHYAKEAEYVGDEKESGLRSLYTVEKQIEMLKAYFGSRQIRTITYGSIKQFRSVRSKTPTRSGGQRSWATINRELALLRRMLNVALGEGWIVGKNPFKQGDPLICVAKEKKRERIITAAEEKALLDACSAPKRGHLRAIIIAALDTGCRRGELLKLRWQDVDLEAGIIKIIALNSKTAKPRAVAITDRLRAELERLYAESPKDPRLTVFGGLQSVKKSFVGARNDAGLRGLRLHDLRHTAATRLVRAHIPLSEVGRILGHQQPNTTYRYTNADAETANRAAAALNAFNAQTVETVSETVM